MNTSLTINSTKNLIMWYKVTYYNALREFDKLQFILLTHTMRYGAILNNYIGGGPDWGAGLQPAFSNK